MRDYCQLAAASDCRSGSRERAVNPDSRLPSLYRGGGGLVDELRKVVARGTDVSPGFHIHQYDSDSRLCYLSPAALPSFEHDGTRIEQTPGSIDSPALPSLPIRDPESESGESSRAHALADEGALPARSFTLSSRGGRPRLFRCRPRPSLSCAQGGEHRMRDARRDIRRGWEASSVFHHPEHRGAAQRGGGKKRGGTPTPTPTSISISMLISITDTTPSGCAGSATCVAAASSCRAAPRALRILAPSPHPWLPLCAHSPLSMRAVLGAAPAPSPSNRLPSHLSPDLVSPPISAPHLISFRLPTQLVGPRLPPLCVSRRLPIPLRVLCSTTPRPAPLPPDDFAPRFTRTHALPPVLRPLSTTRPASGVGSRSEAKGEGVEVVKPAPALALLLPLHPVDCDARRSPSPHAPAPPPRAQLSRSRRTPMRGFGVRAVCTRTLYAPRDESNPARRLQRPTPAARCLGAASCSRCAIRPPTAVVRPRARALTVLLPLPWAEVEAERWAEGGGGVDGAVGGGRAYERATLLLPEMWWGRAGDGGGEGDGRRTDVRTCCELRLRVSLSPFAASRFLPLCIACPAACPIRSRRGGRREEGWRGWTEGGGPCALPSALSRRHALPTCTLGDLRADAGRLSKEGAGMGVCAPHWKDMAQNIRMAMAAASRMGDAGADAPADSDAWKGAADARSGRAGDVERSGVVDLPSSEGRGGRPPYARLGGVFQRIWKCVGDGIGRREGRGGG
ncbi:hypothetical protein B0H11DRAFT_1926565 [Mycena galericulata]|nr:hypothetical protein B0H11DRAFT_1926565 [Mycena galericulata]